MSPPNIPAVLVAFVAGTLTGAAAARARKGRQARPEATIEQRTQALARREALYRSIADLSPQIIFLTDPDGNPVYLNRAWHDIVGPRTGGWGGQRWLDALHPEDRGATAHHIRAAMRGHHSFCTRFRLRDTGGSYRACLSTGAPVRGPDGQVEWWVGVCTDVTELERRERELQALNDELASFSYTLSHDLRAPVEVMGGFLDALVHGQVGRVDEAAHGYLLRVRRNAHRMRELIDDVLLLARLSRERPRPQRFDLVALAQRAMEAVRERYPGRVVELLAPPALQVVADPRLMRLLLENLLDNAVKFSPGEAVCRVELSGWHEVDTVVLQVADRGVGFPPDMADRLFQPFQRLHADTAFRGTGIGLATVARVARLHHGRVTASARPGGGSVFELRMPVLREAPPGEGARC